MAIVVERPGMHDWARVRALRLAALADSPDAFGSTLAEEVDQPAQFWRDRLSRAGATTLVAVLDGRDAGMIVVADADDAATGGIYSVCVAPHARGRGVGDALVAAALHEARARGYARVVLEVGEANTPARALYRRHGFVPTGRHGHLPAPREHLAEIELELTLG